MENFIVYYIQNNFKLFYQFVFKWQTICNNLNNFSQKSKLKNGKNLC